MGVSPQASAASASAPCPSSAAASAGEPASAAACSAVRPAASRGATDAPAASSASPVCASSSLHCRSCLFVNRQLDTRAWGQRHASSGRQQHHTTRKAVLCTDCEDKSRLPTVVLEAGHLPFPSNEVLVVSLDEATLPCRCCRACCRHG